MAKIIGLPKLSPTMEEGTLVEWTKQEGDDVEIDDLLAEVETDKATMEFRSFDKGVLLKILVPAGETLEPDTPVAIIGDRGEDISELVASVGSGASAKAAQPEKATPEETKQAEPMPHELADETRKTIPVPGKAQSPAEGSGRAFASPLVRRLAREHDVDLRRVQGSGPHGRIVKRDFDRFLEEDLPTQVTAPLPGAPRMPTGERLPPRVEKASPTRKTIARRLTESKQNVPHFYLTIDVNAEPLVAARKQMNATLKESGEKVSFNDIVLKACAVALRQVPECNASWLGDSIAYHNVVDISVAVAIPDGLITPVVRDADLKGVLHISREIKDLAERARNKKLRPEEISDGTFSLSNLGMYGVEEFAAVINPPEGALLAVGGLRDAPVVKDGQLAAGKKMKVTLSCDHRVVDGAVGARWLQAFQRIIENPVSMLL